MRDQLPRMSVESDASVDDAEHAGGMETGSSSLFGREGRLPPIDFAELRRQVTIGEVLDFFRWEPVARHGPQLRGPCPIHRSTSERSRTFSVNTEKNIFRCFKPACGAQGNQLDLFAQATGRPFLEAAHELCHRLGITPPSTPGTEKRNP